MLTDIKIKGLKPREKAYKVYDGEGLYLYVTPKGMKSWRFDYRWLGKRKTAVLGRYPELGLREARERLFEIRKALREGRNPFEKKDDIGLFKDLAERWFTTNQKRWSPGHRKTIKYRLNLYILPALGDKRLNEITRGDVLELIEKIKITGKTETTRRVLMIINGIFQYAYDMELIDKIPSLYLSKYIGPIKENHYPTILEPERIGELLRKIETYPNVIVRNALKFLILVFVRPGELRLARWAEFNLEERVWDIPAERMKIKKPHRVFLSRQAMEILEFMKEYPKVDENGYVFYGRKLNTPLSDATLNRALRIMGYDTKKEITSHGFRAMARTIIHEKLGYPPEVIEHQLAHKVPDPLGEAYNRTKFYEQRRQMMQDWADWLDETKNLLSRSNHTSKIEDVRKHNNT